MKKIINDIKEKGRLMMLSSCTILGLLLASCDYWHDSYEGCEELLKTHLRVQFIYDMNMKFADAFPHEVKNVTLYAFDQQGKLAYTKTEAAEKIIAEEGMNIDDLTPGVYDLLVWAQGEERYADSYTFGQASIGSSACDVLKATVNRSDKGIIDHDLTPLFHGQLAKADFTKMEKGGTRTVKVSLTKNTNQVKVVLQNLSGVNLSADDFIFQITDNNGRIDYDNSLMEDEMLTYNAWSTYSGTAGVSSGTSEQTSVACAIAELTTNRLVKGHDMRLHVYNRETGASIINIPLIDYALMVKGNYNKSMSDQEYLDRQDSYDLVFFIDENHKWQSASVIINSWRVVLSKADM